MKKVKLTSYNTQKTNRVLMRYQRLLNRKELWMSETDSIKRKELFNQYYIECNKVALIKSIITSEYFIDKMSEFVGFDNKTLSKYEIVKTFNDDDFIKFLVSVSYTTRIIKGFDKMNYDVKNQLYIYIKFFSKLTIEDE